MIEQLKHTDKIKVENYGLYEFLLDLQKAVLQGYELDDSNEGWPQIYGSLYTCLLKKKAEVVPEEATIVAQDATPEVPSVMTSLLQTPTEQPSAARRGPKPKNNL